MVFVHCRRGRASYIVTVQTEVAVTTTAEVVGNAEMAQLDQGAAPRVAGEQTEDDIGTLTQILQQARNPW